MALKRLDENPTISDQVIIDLYCPDADGCFIENPYKVNNITIYFVQRAYGNTYTPYDKTVYDPEIEADLKEATAAACEDDSEENLAEVERLTAALSASAKVDTFYYSDAQPVTVLGDGDTPAWIEDGEENKIDNIDEDENEEAVFGRFELIWDAAGMREGDYFICWTWTPNVDGATLSSHQHFYLNGDTQITTSIPTHFTDPEKYPAIMERYLPEMFKQVLSDTDMTPEVLQELNLAVGKGFETIENMGNQLLDMIDANATHEHLLPLLGNLFGLKLRTGDPTLWRRQIKKAVPLFKKKGTLPGLAEALELAGVKLNRFVRLWQVISNYTYQEAFVVTDSLDFTLSKTAILPLDTDNFELYYRAADDDDWTELTSDYVTLTNDDAVTTMSWIGDTLSYAPIELAEGDSVRVVYQIAEVPSEDEQTIEDYIRTLSLADQRDERDQNYPIKNWNVRVIEEDDAMLDLVIPQRHPYYDPIIYGKIRTLFPYSENSYNMEEYNGSTRDSTEPCDIDKDFVDTCTSCLGSKFNVDLEIENLSTDRIAEVQEIIREYTPFHAVLHSINLVGTFNEIIQVPVETINPLVTVSGEDFTISGNAQTIFGRSMSSSAQIKRNELANVTTVVSSASGTAFNEYVCLFSPWVRLDELGLHEDSAYTVLEVLSPSANAGEYTVENADKHIAFVDGGTVSEPIDESAFTFRLSNIRGSKASVTITQDDYFTFSDAEVDFYTYDIKTQWDIDNNEYDGSPWTVTIAAYSDTYEIQNILPDGRLVLADPSQTLPTSTTTGVTYVLKNGDGEEIETTNTGKITVKRRGLIDLGNTISILGTSHSLSDIRGFFDSYHEHGANHYVMYDGTQYPFDGFVDGALRKFYIRDYSDGDAAGVPIDIYHRLVDGKKGYFAYKGLKLQGASDHEVGLNICNGDNADTLFAATDAHGDPYTLQLEDNTFYQNFLVLIDTEYFALSRIDGDEMWLVGPDNAWTTTGTAVTYDILHYEKEGAEIDEVTYPPMPGHTFEMIDRRGNEVVLGTFADDYDTPITALAAVFNSPEDQIIETIGQTEGISFSIQTREQGEE
jgi:hypothetical protein